MKRIKSVWLIVLVPMILGSVGAWIFAWLNWAIKSDPTPLRVFITMAGMFGIPLGIVEAILNKKFI